MKHFLKLLDLTTEEILELLDLADQLKLQKKQGIEHHILKGKTLGMIFENPPPEPVYPLKQACISWAAMRCSSAPKTHRSVVANPQKTPQEFCPVIWTAS